MALKFDKNYFQNGNYQNYLTRDFDQLAADLIAELSFSPSDRIIDFGCGYGGLVWSLYNKGFKLVYGTDISNWAIEYGQSVFPTIKGNLQYYNRNLLSEPKEFILLLDVLEHMPIYEVECILKLASERLSKYIIAKIPVSLREGEKFFLDVSNNDPTHINCHSRNWWLDFFGSNNYSFAGELRTRSIYSSFGVLAGKWKPNGR